MADKSGCGFSLIIVPVLSALSWLCSHLHPSASTGGKKKKTEQKTSQSLRQDSWPVPSLLVINAENDLPWPQR